MLKTKQMLIDFRRMYSVVPDLFIEGVKAERVNEYKYLGTGLNNNLTFTSNTDFYSQEMPANDVLFT